MIPAEPVSWAAAVPVVLAGVAVLFVPGWVTIRLLGGLRTGRPSGLELGAAPLVTVSVLCLGAVLAGRAGIPWSPATFLVLALLTWGAAAALGLLLRRWTRPVTAEPDGPGPAAGLVAAAVAFLTAALAILPATGAASAIPQNPDTIFHLGLARRMLQRADVSTLHAAGFTGASDQGFYPAAFHGVAVTLAQLTGSSVVVASNALALVAAAVVWPAGCLLLARLALGSSPLVLGCAAVASGLFSPFPYWLMGYGVLWPNLLGQSLLPAALALLTVAAPATGVGARAGERGGATAYRPLLGALLLVAGLPGLAIAHPNTVFALTVLGSVYLLWTVGWHVAVSWRRGLRRTAAGLSAAFVAAAGLLGAGYLVLTRASTTMREFGALGGEVGIGPAVVQTLSFSPRGLPPQWVAGGLVLLGAAVLLRRRAHAWLPLAWLAAGTLFVLSYAVDSPQTRWLTWPWYNNPPRLAALVVLPAVVLATAGATQVATWVASLSDRMRRGRRWARLTPRGLALVVPALLFLATGLGGRAAHEQTLLPYFRPANQAQDYISRSELAALRTLGARIPADAVVAANPWKGAQYLYLVSGQRMLFPTEKTLGATASAEADLLARRMDRAATDARVCRAMQRERVTFVITGGQPTTRSAWRRYRGVDAVGTSPAFRPVAQAEPYRLFQFTGCPAAGQ